MKFISSLLLLSLLSLTVRADTPIPPQSLDVNECNRALGGKTPLDPNFDVSIKQMIRGHLSPEAVSALHGYAYILVGGYMSDLPVVALRKSLQFWFPLASQATRQRLAEKTLQIWAIYQQPMKELIIDELGVNPDHVLLVRPDSGAVPPLYSVTPLPPEAYNRLTLNAEKLYEAVIQMHEKTGLPVAVQGHSMGGPTIELMVAMHPELIEKNLVPFLLGLQPANGGNNSADLAAENGSPLEMIPGMMDLIGGGAEALKHNFPNRVISYHLNLALLKMGNNDEQKKYFLDRFSEISFWVRSQMNPQLVGTFTQTDTQIRQFEASQIRKGLSPEDAIVASDGLLSPESQKLKLVKELLPAAPPGYFRENFSQFGNELGMAHENVNHMQSMVANSPWAALNPTNFGFSTPSETEPGFAKAFARASLDAVGKELHRRKVESGK